jgi:type I restriction enzyme S subunit
MSFPRYPAYKPSGVEWLGEVPEHWEEKPLKTVTSINDEVLSESESTDHEIEYVDISSVSLANGIERTESVIFGDAPSRARRIPRDGDVLVSTVRTYLKAIAPVVSPPSNLVASTGFAVVRPQRGIHPGYLKYALQEEHFIQQVISRSTGVSYPAINASDIARIPLSLPKQSEQLAIATFLDRETAKIDALIAEQQRLIELLQEKRQAVISHAVTKGLNPDAPMKDSGVEWLGEVPEHWAISPIKYLARVGNGSTPNRDNSEYWTDDGFPWLNSSVVNKAEVLEAERFVTKLALKECHLPIVEPPAALVGITGQGRTRGMAAQLMLTATVNQHVAFIKPSTKRIAVDYLLRVLEASYDRLRLDSEGSGSTKGAITCEQLGLWSVPLPDHPEQEEIVSFLKVQVEMHESLKAESERAIELLQERRSALISAAVTGQIDVRGVVAEGSDA